MKPILTLILVFFATFGFSQLEMISHSCPNTAPIANASIQFDVLVANTADTTVSGENLNMHQAFFESGVSNDNLYNSQPIPTLAAGETTTINYSFVLPSNFVEPGTQASPVAWGGLYLKIYYHPFFPVGPGNDDLSVDFDCIDACATPTGHTLLGTYNEHQYFISDESSNWPAAQAAAQDAGGYLVSFNDQGENDFITNLISEMVFIGYSDSNNDGNFTWDSDEPIAFNNEGAGAGDQYAHMNFWNGQWGFDGQWTQRKYILELPCGDTVPPTCEITNQTWFTNLLEEPILCSGYSKISIADIPDNEQIAILYTGSAPNSPFGFYYCDGTYCPGNSNNCLDVLANSTIVEDVWTVSEFCDDSANCLDNTTDYTLLGGLSLQNYYLSNDLYTWTEAQALAAAEGGYLASFSSDAEIAFVTGLINEIVFIGYNDADNDGAYQWDSGEIVNINNQTGPADAPFANMNFWNGAWGFDGEYTKRRFVLEIPCDDAPPECIATNQQWLIDILNDPNLCDAPVDIRLVNYQGDEYVNIGIDWYDCEGNYYCSLGDDSCISIYINGQILETIFDAADDCDLPVDGPDITVTDFCCLENEIEIGAVADFYFDLSNIGLITAFGDYKIGIYLSTDQTYSNDDVEVGEIVTGNTAVGTTADVYGAITVADVNPGTHYMIIVVDVDQVIVESNETNNSWVVNYPINIIESMPNPCHLNLGAFDDVACANFNTDGSIATFAISANVASEISYNADGSLNTSTPSNISQPSYTVENNQIVEYDVDGVQIATYPIDDNLVNYYTSDENYLGSKATKNPDGTFFILGINSMPPPDPSLPGNSIDLEGTDLIYMHKLDASGNEMGSILIREYVYDSPDYYYGSTGYLTFQGMVPMTDGGVVVWSQENTVFGYGNGYRFEVDAALQNVTTIGVGSCSLVPLILEVSTNNCDGNRVKQRTVCSSAGSSTSGTTGIVKVYDYSVSPPKLIYTETRQSGSGPGGNYTSYLSVFPLSNGNTMSFSTYINLSVVFGNLESSFIVLKDANETTLQAWEDASFSQSVVDVFENPDGSISFLSIDGNSIVLNNTSCYETGTGDECPEEIDGYTTLGTYENHQYYLSDDAATWTNAQAEAAAQGGHLASFSNLAENEFVADLIDEMVFIGLSDAENEEHPTWDDESGLNFDNMTGVNSEANDYGNMNFWNGGWSYDGPYTQRRYVLELDCTEAASMQQTFSTPSLSNTTLANTPSLALKKLYPNPTNQDLFVQFESEKSERFTLLIYNSIGHLVAQQNVQLESGLQSVEINIHDLPAGMFIVQFGDTSIPSQRFLKL